MTQEDTIVSDLIINLLTKELFNGIETPSNTEIYLTEELEEDPTLAKDENVVHLIGTETISGNKTFTGSIVLDNARATTPSSNDNSQKVATTAFVQELIAGLDARISTIETRLDQIING